MIEISEVTKIYKSGNNGVIKAVDNVNLKIEEGSIICLLGPNGAGKSTLIKMILGVMIPTSGKITIYGKDAYLSRKALIKHIGIVFGQRSQLWWDLPAMDTYCLLCKIYEMDKTEFEIWLDDIINLLDAKEIVNKPVRFLSLGQRMRCEIIAALCFKPKIIILDEPTIGLDITVKEKIREFLVYLNKKTNVTILLTTHDLEDIEAVCSRVVVFNHGKILYDDTARKIKGKNNNKNCKIIFTPQKDLGSLPYSAEIVAMNNKQVINIAGEISEIMRAIEWCGQNGDIEDMIITKPKIEDIIKKYY